MSDSMLPPAEGRAPAAWDSEELSCLHRWGGPVLLVHPDAALRGEIARRIHAARGTRHGSLLLVDCRRLARTGRAVPAWHELWSDHHGTVYLDHLEALPLPLQRQLLAWLDRQAERAGSPAWSGPRLVAGVGATRAGLGLHSPLLPELLDTLDKLRLDLGAGGGT